jgi:TrkA domain protein
VSDAIPAVSEQNLPGIGRSYQMSDAANQPVTVVIHHSGRRDLYLGNSPQRSTATFTDDQARRLGAILGGAYFRPAVVAQVEAMIGGLLIDWVTVPNGSRAAGCSISDLEIRVNTGMTVAAILREGQPIVSPEPTEVLRPGDQLVVLGRPEDLHALLEMIGAEDGS